MASLELQRLWKLAQIDNGLVEVRKRAAGLDVGQTILALIATLEAQDKEIGGKARAMQADANDIELQQKSLDDKIIKFDKQLYGGTVVNAKEVENIEKEIAQLKRQRSALDETLLELWDKLPAAKANAYALTTKIAEARKALADRRKAAVVEKEHLESEFKRLTAARPGAATHVAPGLLVRYDGIRQRTGGIGMVEVTRKQTCSACGLVLPEKTMEDLRDEKTIACEGCRRLLYWTDGAI